MENMEFSVSLLQSQLDQLVRLAERTVILIRDRVEDSLYHDSEQKIHECIEGANQYILSLESLLLDLKKTTNDLLLVSDTKAMTLPAPGRYACSVRRTGDKNFTPGTVEIEEVQKTNSPQRYKVKLKLRFMYNDRMYLRSATATLNLKSPILIGSIDAAVNSQAKFNFKVDLSQEVEHE